MNTTLRVPILLNCNYPRNNIGSVEKTWGRFLNEAYLRRTYLQGRMHVLARMVARTCGKRGSALQGRMQCTASAWTYLVYFKRKYMRPPRITFATADANVINRSRKRLREKAHLGNPFPHGFSNEP